jgi:hypothetical protein
MNGISTRLPAATGAFYVMALVVGDTVWAAGSANGAPAGRVLVVLGFTAFVVFAAFLHRALQEADGPSGWLPTLALDAGLLYSAVVFAAQPPRMIEAYREDALSPELVRTLEDLNGGGFVISGLLLGLFCATASGIGLRHGLFPRWLGWSGAVAGWLALVAGVVGMVAPGLYLPVPFLACLAWTASVSILLTVRPIRRADVAARPAVTTAPVA